MRSVLAFFLPASLYPPPCRLLLLLLVSLVCLPGVFHPFSVFQTLAITLYMNKVRWGKKRNAVLPPSLSLSRSRLPYPTLLLRLSFFPSASRSFARTLYSMLSRRDDFSEEIQTPFRESWRTAKSTRWPAILVPLGSTRARAVASARACDAYLRSHG